MSEGDGSRLNLPDRMCGEGRFCIPRHWSRRKAALDGHQARFEKAERVRHSGVPWGRAGHLRGVVGNDDAVEAVFIEDPQDAQHVHVAIVDEGFVIVRSLSADVAEVNVGDAVLAAVPVDSLVELAFGHLGEGSQAKFEHVAGAGREIDEPLVHGLLIDEARLAAHGGRGWIVRVRGEADAGLLGHRESFFKNALQAPPEFVVRDGGQGARRRGGS